MLICKCFELGEMDWKHKLNFEEKVTNLGKMKYYKVSVLWGHPKRESNPFEKFESQEEEGKRGVRTSWAHKEEKGQQL